MGLLDSGFEKIGRLQEDRGEDARTQSSKEVNYCQC